MPNSYQLNEYCWRALMANRSQKKTEKICHKIHVIRCNAISNLLYFLNGSHMSEITCRRCNKMNRRGIDTAKQNKTWNHVGEKKAKRNIKLNNNNNVAEREWKNERKRMCIKIIVCVCVCVSFSLSVGRMRMLQSMIYNIDVNVICLPIAQSSTKHNWTASQQ